MVSLGNPTCLARILRSTSRKALAWLSSIPTAAVARNGLELKARPSVLGVPRSADPILGVSKPDGIFDGAFLSGVLVPLPLLSILLRPRGLTWRGVLERVGVEKSGNILCAKLSKALCFPWLGLADRLGLLSSKDDLAGGRCRIRVGFCGGSADSSRWRFESKSANLGIWSL